jgi:tripartite motif-containing protein 2/3/tripartite motif-containing protein 71
MKGFDGPCGVAVNSDNYVFVVNNRSNRIKVLDGNGMDITTFGENGDVKFSHPRGIAITQDNHILVTDDHRIQKISMDGTLVAIVGVRGNKKLEFNYPCGIAVSPVTQQIYIADSSNSRIQVLNPDLSFCFMFGGDIQGEFMSPVCIAIDDGHNIYATDSNSLCIQKFTSSGQFLYQIKSQDFPLLPVGITIKRNVIYVAGGIGNQNLSAFTTSGRYIGSCFSQEGEHLEEITFDNEGNLYVCDYYNDSVLVF